MATTPTQQWFVEHKAKIYGPMAADRLKALAAAGKISPDDQVRAGTDGPWQSAGSLPGLFSTTSAPPPAPAPPPSSPLLGSPPPQPQTLSHPPPTATSTSAATTSASGSILKWLLVAAILMAMGAGLFCGGFYAGGLYARLTAPLPLPIPNNENELADISAQLDSLKQQLAQQQAGTPQQSGSEAQLLGTLNALLGAQQSVSEPPPPTNLDFVESAGEPSEAQMRAAFERRIAAVNDHVEEAENAPVDPNDPLAAIQALNAEAFRDSRLRLVSFKKLSAAPAANPPGYICEYEAEVRATGQHNPAFYEILAESGTTAQGRFAETADGWIVLPANE